ncbi:MAG: hypothetical protein K2Q26_08260 [Bdellovibrionales bacterium]|nr:hypothetical protein [Bdellovibrionales bacterium]
MRRLFQLCSSTLLISNFAFAGEPTLMNPENDARLVQSLQLADSRTSDRINILVIGLDEKNNRSSETPLDARSDIMTIISLDKVKKKVSLFSYGRDLELTPSCSQRISGRNRGDKLLSSTYLLAGRRVFVKCLEQMTVEFLNVNEGFKREYLDSQGRFQIHAVFEATRSYTMSHVTKEAFEQTKRNWLFFMRTYGLMSFQELLSVAVNRQALKENFNEALADDSTPTDQLLSTQIVTEELQERKKYPAGSYQRSFNFALFLSDILSWVACGIKSNENSRPFFMGEIFGETLNKYLGRSTDFATFERSLVSHAGPNDHLLKYAGYASGVSPVRIIQWGEERGVYSIYENGELQISRRNHGQFLPALKVVKVMPTPPNCYTPL